MLIWAAAATAVSIILILILTAYRRQVRDICRRLAFIKENRTNMRLSSEVSLKDMNELIDMMNEIIDLSREAEIEARRGEDALKETITNISHDIRTPLTSLDGYFQMLSNAESDEERQRYTSIINSRIASLKDMLEELFTYTKLQNKSYELPLMRICFSKCVFDTVFSFYEDFKDRGDEPQIDFCEERIFIEGSEEGVRRIVQNVIKNALVHGAGELTVRMRSDGRYVKFICENAVKDPKEIDVSQVFTRFYKADTSRRHSSTGLGLAIAKGLAERMGGEMTAEVVNGRFILTAEFAIDKHPEFVTQGTNSRAGKS